MEEQPLTGQEWVQESAAEEAEGAKAPQAASREGLKERVTLSIKGQGMQFDRDISEAQVLSILRLLLGGEQGGYVPEERGSSFENSGRSTSRQAISEFYRGVAPKRYPEKLVTIAAYLKQTQGRNCFTPEELRAQFRHVNETPPANLSRDFKAALRARWIAPDPEAPGQFFVTQPGLDAVESSFSIDAKKASKPRRRRKNSVKTEQGTLAVE